MELLAFLGALSLVSVQSIIISILAVIVVLAFVVMDEMRGNTLDGGWKYVVFIGGFIALGAIAGIKFSTVAWAPILMQFAAAGGLVILAKLVEGIWVSRQTMGKIANDARHEFAVNLKHLAQSLTTKYADLVQISTDFKSSTGSLKREDGSIISFEDWLFGFKTEADRAKPIHMNAPIAQVAELFSGSRDALTYFTNVIRGNPGATLNSREMQNHWLNYLYETRDALIVGNGLSLNALMEVGLGKECIRQTVAYRFAKLYYSRSNMFLQSKLNQDSTDYIHGFTDAIPEKNLHALHPTTLGVDFFVGRLAGLLTTWFLLWPFYAIELIFGRLLEAVGRILAAIVRKFSVKFLNKIVFSGIA